MQNTLSIISLSDPGSLIPSLLPFFGNGNGDNHPRSQEMEEERRQGLQHIWYQRIMMLAGVLLIITGLMIFTFTDLLTPGSPHWLSSAFFLVFLFGIVASGIYALLIIIRSTLRLSTQQQELFVGRIDAEQVSIAASPLPLITQMLLIGGTFLLLVAVLLGIFQSFSLMTRHQLFFWGWVLLIAVPFLTFWLIRMSIRLRTLLRIERLGRSLVIERSVKTASLPGSAAFFSPLSITLRIKRIPIGIFAAIVVGFLMPDAIHLVVQLMQSGTLDLFIIFWIAFGLVLLVFAFIPFFIVQTTIEVKENGLRTEAGKFLSWHEARLFACYCLPDILPGRSTMVYLFVNKGYSKSGAEVGARNLRYYTGKIF